MDEAVARADEMAARYERSLANQRKLIDGMQRKLMKIEEVASGALAIGDESGYVMQLQDAIHEIIAIKNGATSV